MLATCVPLTTKTGRPSLICHIGLGSPLYALTDGQRHRELIRCPGRKSADHWRQAGIREQRDRYVLSASALGTVKAAFSTAVQWNPYEPSLVPYSLPSYPRYIAGCKAAPAQFLWLDSVKLLQLWQELRGEGRPLNSQYPGWYHAHSPVTLLLMDD